MATDNELAIPTSESESGRPRSSDSSLFGFPHPVNETSARVVAGGVVSMVTATIASRSAVDPLPPDLRVRGPGPDRTEAQSSRTDRHPGRDPATRGPPPLLARTAQALGSGHGPRPVRLVTTALLRVRPQAAGLWPPRRPRRGRHPRVGGRGVPGLQDVPDPHALRHRPAGHLRQVRGAGVGARGRVGSPRCQRCRVRRTTNDGADQLGVAVAV